MSRIRLAVRGLFVCLLFLLHAAQAQPLNPGIELDDQRYFVDKGELKILQDSGSVKTPKTGIGEAKSLLKPSDSWSDSVIVKTESSYFFFDKDGAKELAEGDLEKIQAFVWGDQFALLQEGTLKLVSSDASIIENYLGNLLEAPRVLDSESLLMLREMGRGALEGSDEPTHVGYRVQGKPVPTPLKLSFTATSLSPKGLKVTQNQSEVVLWHPESQEIFMVNSGAKISLRNPPTGVKILQGTDSFVATTRLGKQLISPDGEARVIANPKTILTKLDHYVQASQEILTLGEQDGELLVGKVPQIMLGEPPQSLGNLTLKTLVPSEGSSRTLILGESKLEETKTDDSGHVVVNPKTGKKESHSVVGHALFLHTGDNDWKELSKDERSRAVGPAQKIGDQFIFATQTEPLHKEGESRDINHRYPYPQVKIHAFDCATGDKSWTLELDRGAAPSGPRLPEEEWPISSEGNILFTTEDHRLASVDPKTGQIQWNSEHLPMDDSRPPMFAWGDTLGMLATDRTTRKMLVLDKSGNLVESVRLNTIFNWDRKLNLAGVVVICLALIIYIYLAGRKKLFIRRIAGLEALDEAVGRATEMGKPVLYVTGLADVDDIQTLAALSILSHVAKKTAEYDTPILATTSRAVTFSAAQEIVRDSFNVVGRPDSFQLESVRYISDDQFGYAAGVDGLMVREEPAANFYMGKFYAESLIFAETGYATGAIQIAGTAQANQLPFFVAACDYTLIGEELFAASAYLSGEPLQVGSLRGQDVGKAIVMIVLVILSLWATYKGLF